MLYVDLAEQAQAAAAGLQRESDIDAIAARYVRALRRFFLRQARLFLVGFERFQQEIDIDAQEAQLREAQPDWGPIWDQVDEQTRLELVEPTTAALRQGMRNGGAAAPAQMGFALSFNLENPEAVAWLEENAAQLVTRIGATTRDRLRTTISAGVAKRQSHSEIASSILDVFRDMGGEKRSRAVTIARTEIGNGYEQAGSMAARDLQRGGLTIEKFWSTVGDDRVSEIDRANEAAGWIALDEMFPSGHDRPLSHPNCRCGLLYRTVRPAVS